MRRCLTILFLTFSFVAAPGAPNAFATPGDALVTVVGDSLVYGREDVYVGALKQAGFRADANGVGSRAIRYGWQCRDASGRLVVVVKPSSDRCRREGLEQLRYLRDSGRLGEHVVLALGTNDSGLYDAQGNRRNLAEVRRVLGERHLYLVTIVKGGRASAPRWNKTARTWCSRDRACSVIDWASSKAGRSSRSYIADGVHLTPRGTAARAELIAAAMQAAAPVP